MKTLTAAPERLRTATFGTYRGEAIWAFPKRLTSLTQEKKWQWFGAFFERYAIGGAIVDLTYAGKVFIWVFDRKTKTFVHSYSKTLSSFQVSVANDALASTVASTKGFEIRRPDMATQWIVRIDLPQLKLDLFLESTLDPMLAVCPVADHPERHNVTRKQVALRAHGELVLKGSKSTLTKGFAMLDHSHGLMARTTSWKWAMGGGVVNDTAVGFNAIQDFNDDLENAAWHGDTLVHTASALILKEKDHWRVQTSCGAVDLTLDIEGTRTEDINLKLIQSTYQQPLGIWRGKILGHSVAIPGVAEDHLAKW